MCAITVTVEQLQQLNRAHNPCMRMHRDDMRLEMLTISTSPVALYHMSRKHKACMQRARSMGVVMMPNKMTVSVILVDHAKQFKPVFH